MMGDFSSDFGLINITTVLPPQPCSRCFNPKRARGSGQVLSAYLAASVTADGLKLQVFCLLCPQCFPFHLSSFLHFLLTQGSHKQVGFPKGLRGVGVGRANLLNCQKQQLCFSYSRCFPNRPFVLSLEKGSSALPGCQGHLTGRTLGKRKQHLPQHLSQENNGVTIHRRRRAAQSKWVISEIQSKQIILISTFQEGKRQARRGGQTSRKEICPKEL